MKVEATVIFGQSNNTAILCFKRFESVHRNPDRRPEHIKMNQKDWTNVFDRTGPAILEWTASWFNPYRRILKKSKTRDHHRAAISEKIHSAALHQFPYLSVLGGGPKNSPIRVECQNECTLAKFLTTNFRIFNISIYSNFFNF